ncbi:MAG: cyanophycinase [Caldilineaceae bacterium]|nr:cyanophycinase [Caldilineaceae bacterium]
MPAPVPPGFTRGPIMFMGPLIEEQSFARMLQSFWDEAGGYGARILIVSTAAADAGHAERFRRWLVAAEVEWVELLRADNRRAAHDPALVSLVESATGILIIDGNPLRFVGLLGGTPVAQSIRRVNARGRVICGVGQGGAVMSQHMVVSAGSPTGAESPLTPALIRFAPGLGIVNRMTVDCDGEAGTNIRTHLPRLLTAVAYNPFLIGVALDPDTGVVLYANSVLEVFGAGSALIVDGAHIEECNLYDTPLDQPFQIKGVEIHTLAHGDMYNLDAHEIKRPPESEIPQAGYEKYTSF